MIWARAFLFLLIVQVPAVALLPAALVMLQGSNTLQFLYWPATGAALIAVGAIAILWCDYVFVRQGRGTAAPYDQTRALVGVGLYRWTRNPMYVAALLVIVGEALLWHSGALVAYAVVVAGALHVYVVYFEEPRLRGRFSPSYDQYCARVPRWVPRIPQAVSDRSHQ